MYVCYIEFGEKRINTVLYIVLPFNFFYRNFGLLLLNIDFKKKCVCLFVCFIILAVV